MVFPPASQLAPLAESAKIGDIQVLRDQVKVIAQQDGEDRYAQFIHEILALADNYNMRKIRKMIRRAAIE
jgi:hypothetical protein